MENQQIAALVALVLGIAVVGSVIATVLRMRAGAPGARPDPRGAPAAAAGDAGSTGSPTRDTRDDDGGHSPDDGVTRDGSTPGASTPDGSPDSGGSSDGGGGGGGGSDGGGGGGD